jgi:hypothetical protein
MYPSRSVTIVACLGIGAALAIVPAAFTIGLWCLVPLVLACVCGVWLMAGIE